MQSETTQAIVEALKEGARYLVFAVVTSVGGVILSGINTQTGVIAINWQIAYALALFTAVTTVLRMLDKYKYIFTKLTEETAKGVLPF